MGKGISHKKREEGECFSTPRPKRHERFVEGLLNTMEAEVDEDNEINEGSRRILK